jgi:ectoine hydroxylase
MGMTDGLSAAEHERWRRDGYVVRGRIFDSREIAALVAAVESVATAVRTHAERPGAGPERRLADGHRLQLTSRSAVQWEWREGSREIRLIEPVTHLDARIAAATRDRRIVEPMCAALRVAAVGLFTSKLNLKRPREGSEFPYHQDFPYWYVRVEDAARDIVTAMLFLDDTRISNGALRVLPGSHLHGPAPRRTDGAGDPSLADPAQLDVRGETAVEVPAGSMLMFGSLLVHRSSPNESGAQRRALLFSYQPAGRPDMQQANYRPELLQRLP